jgi:hypothetical protein
MSHANIGTGSRIGPWLSKGLGVLITVVALFLAVEAIKSALVLTWHLAFVLLGLYALVGVLQFWVSESWRDGITKRESRNSLLWYKEAWSQLRAGVKPSSGRNAVFALSNQDSSEAVIVPAKWSLLVGIVASFFVGLIAVSLVVDQLWPVGIAALGILVPVYFVGMAFTFWATGTHRNSLSGSDIKALLAWPLAYKSHVRSAVSNVSSRASATVR